MDPAPSTCFGTTPSLNLMPLHPASPRTHFIA